MAQFHVCVLLISLLLLQLPCLQAMDHHLYSSPCSLSFQLLLQPAPPLNLHTAAPLQQPLTGPHLFADEPLVQYSHDGAQLSNVVGRASGLYLADSADCKQVRYLYFTATLQQYEYEEGGQLLSGSLVLIGSLSAGALSIIGGTGDFAFVMGQAKVSMAPATSNSTLAISLHLELLYEDSHHVDITL